MQERPITYGSVCSGIEAATVAWHGLGWKPEWFAEIEPFPSAVLAHHYPDVMNMGDMTKLPELVENLVEAAPDILVGGTPCQAFSVAGLRGGLSDHRGQLTLSYVELANAIDSARNFNGQEPCIIVWENVPGVLSSKDNAFGCFLAGLVGEECELQPPGQKWANAGYVLGPQRAVAWRILDAQYFGVAQRRRRVFVVASARDDFDPAAVLFEFDGLRRDTPPSRETRQEVASATGESLTSSGRWVERTGDTRGQDPVVACYPLDLRNALRDPDKFDAVNRQGSGIGEDGDPMVTLTSAHVHGVVSSNRMVAFGEYVDDGTASTMKMRGYKDATDLAVYSLQGNMLGRKPENGPAGSGISEDLNFTLTKTDVHAVCVTGDITHTLRAEGFDASEDGTGRGNPIVVHDTQDPCTDEKLAFALGRNSGQENAVLPPAIGWNGDTTPKFSIDTTTMRAQQGGEGFGVMTPAMHVRRLTPVECERLQGFPDSYTAIPVKGKPAADGPRYKALGNSMAVPVMAWIGRRIHSALTK